jgi:hypothetical protein
MDTSAKKELFAGGVGGEGGASLRRCRLPINLAQVKKGIVLDKGLVENIKGHKGVVRVVLVPKAWREPGDTSRLRRFYSIKVIGYNGTHLYAQHISVT